MTIERDVNMHPLAQEHKLKEGNFSMSRDQSCSNWNYVELENLISWLFADILMVNTM